MTVCQLPTTSASSLSSAWKNTNSVRAGENQELKNTGFHDHFGFVYQYFLIKWTFNNRFPFRFSNQLMRLLPATIGHQSDYSRGSIQVLMLKEHN